MRDTHTEREREREAETQAEGEAGSMQGARCGTGSPDSGITLWAKGRYSTTKPPRCPDILRLKKNKIKSVMGTEVAQLPKCLPSAQDMIPGSGIESHVGLLAGSLRLPLPVSLPLCVSCLLYTSDAADDYLEV